MACLRGPSGKASHPKEQPMRTLAAVAQAIAAEIHNILVWLMPPDEE